MPRANRVSAEGLIWHVSHRCHKQEFLLRFARDRRRWRHWLYVACRRYGLSVLNYVATSNHVHLLVADNGGDSIPSALQLVSSRVAQEYNRRKVRHGAFWEDRYHATAVQSGHHLMRCMAYIDLNMVRAGAVSRPSHWDVCGYNEIQRPWKRKSIIDSARLCQLLEIRDSQQLATTCERLVLQKLASTFRNSIWTEAVAVGDTAFLESLRKKIGIVAAHRTIHTGSESCWLSEESGAYLAFSPLKRTIRGRKPPRNSY